MELKQSEQKTIVTILSTMRSGSTLLKALLSVGPDVSNLPETDFQRFQGKDGYQKLSALSQKPILVLKRPGWFNEIGRYPKFPNVPRLKKIVLVRDAYENVVSLRNMAFRWSPFKFEGSFNKFFAEKYWAGTYERLLDLAENDPEHTTLVRYEDILKNPVWETKRLFTFIGSAQKEGTKTYNRPENYSWAWGKDDGSDKIKTLTVQPPRPTKYSNIKLLKTIQHSERVRNLRRKLGYPPLASPTN